MYSTDGGLGVDQKDVELINPVLIGLTLSSSSNKSSQKGSSESQADRV
jgi:hypothetical protein